MILTVQALASACEARIDRAQLHHPYLVEAARAYQITTKRRCAAWLGNIGHESMSLRYTQEIWGPTAAQMRYERDFTQPWPANGTQAREPRFERNRLAFSLGNTQQGDGRRYGGHGLLQNTGRRNHIAVRDRLRKRFPSLAVPDFELDPDRLAEPRWSALAAGDYWAMRELSPLADDGRFDAVCDVINRGRITAVVGDSNGWKDRLRRYEVALAVLHAAGLGDDPEADTL